MTLQELAELRRLLNVAINHAFQERHQKPEGIEVFGGLVEAKRVTGGMMLSWYGPEGIAMWNRQEEDRQEEDDICLDCGKHHFGYYGCKTAEQGRG